MKKYCWPINVEKKEFPEDSARKFKAKRNNNRFHTGTDLMTKEGTDVFSIEKGIVKKIFLFTYPGLDDYNDYLNTYAVVIENEDGNYALYGEVRNVKVKEGQEVNPGDKIAEVGRIFEDRPNHTMLHFEYHSKIPNETTKWYKNKKPEGLLNSDEYLREVVKKLG